MSRYSYLFLLIFFTTPLFSNFEKVGVIDELDGNHEDMITGGLAGALVGGLFTALFEGSNIAYEYTLNSKVEGEFSIIQKEKIDTKTGCVKVRISNKASISGSGLHSSFKQVIT